MRAEQLDQRAQQVRLRQDADQRIALHDRKAADAVLVQQLRRFLDRRVRRRRDDLRHHHLADLPRMKRAFQLVALLRPDRRHRQPEVAVGHEADQAAVAQHRQVPDAVRPRDVERFRDRRFGGRRVHVRRHPGAYEHGPARIGG